MKENNFKYTEALKFLDMKACDMKCELNALSVKGNGGSYEATLATEYNFLCELIDELQEKIGY